MEKKINSLKVQFSKVMDDNVISEEEYKNLLDICSIKSKTYKMTTYKQYIPDVWNNDIFTKNVTVYQKLETDIGKVADGTDFAPAVSLDIQTQEIENITTNESDATSAVNVEFLTEKVEEINVEIDEKVSSARKISVFKIASSVVASETAPSV